MPTIMHPDFETCRKERIEVYEKISAIRNAAKKSLRQVVAVHEQTLRSLYLTEVKALERSGCTAKDWTTCRILQNKGSVDVSARLSHLVTHSHMEGLVVLMIDDQNTQDDISPHYGRPGVHHTSLSNSIVSLAASVCNNGMIQNTYIETSAAVTRCGSVRCTSSQPLSHLKLQVGPESGGERPLYLKPEVTMIDVGQQLKSPLGSPDITEPKTKTNTTVVSQGATLRDTPTVDDVFMYPGSCVEGASLVSQSILFPQAAIRNASSVETCLLQWNARVQQSNVTGGMLMEQASVGPSSVVANSVLGPDVHVSCGEVHASILGPNTNAHHQSLVIGVLWPLGRGNVGYGANVGSNHTGRIPDQETVAGEGLFWGLSTVIKFPVNLNRAPYSVVAAGTTLGPQIMTMPFSLVVSSENGEKNSILPGWCLNYSPYTIARSAVKFAKRRQAKRHLSYTGWKILRTHTIRFCLEARNELNNESGKIRGCGDSILSEKGRLAGIRAYTDCAQRFCLHGLLQRLIEMRNEQELVWSELQSTSPLAVENRDPVDWGEFPWEEQEDEWEFQKSFLVAEFPLKEDQSTWFRHCMRTLKELETNFSHRVAKCKRRDDIRGKATIPGYVEAHVAAEDDAVVKKCISDAEELAKKVELLLNEDSEKTRSKL